MTTEQLAQVAIDEFRAQVEQTPGVTFLEPYSGIMAMAMAKQVEAKIGSLGLTPEVISQLLQLIPAPPSNP